MRNVLIVTLLVFFHTLLRAQTDVGIELGAGASIFKFTPGLFGQTYAKANVKPVLSWKIGGFADLKLGGHWHFQPGLSISRKGAEVTINRLGYKAYDSSHHVTKINYIEMPLNLIFKTGKKGQWRFVFGSGVTASYMYGGREEAYFSGSNNGVPGYASETYGLVPGRHYRAFDLGINFIVGVELPFGLFIREYYTFGTMDIAGSEHVTKNRVGGISVGYTFRKL